MPERPRKPCSPSCCSPRRPARPWTAPPSSPVPRRSGHTWVGAPALRHGGRAGPGAADTKGNGDGSSRDDGRHDHRCADRGRNDQARHDHAQRIFLWNYDRDRTQLVTLYNKAMSSQWNSVTELDWATEVDPEALVARRRSRLIVGSPRRPPTCPGSPIASWGDKEFTAPRHRVVQGAAQPVHARRAGRHDGRRQDRRDRAVDRRQVLRRHPDHGRGPPHRGLRQVPARQARRGVPDEPVPRGADHGAARGQPLGHRLPRHADRDREPGPRRVRRHAARDRGAAAQASCSAT